MRYCDYMKEEYHASQSITPIGITDFRNQHIPFGIKDVDRLGHLYVLGKTGVGKSTLMLNMAIADILRGNGLAVMDPHGDLVEELLEYIPKERIEDVVYFNATDVEFPTGYNPLFGVSAKHRHIVVSELISTFKKSWADSWGPRLEYILRFCLLTLLEVPDATLADINPLLSNMLYRNRVLERVRNADVQAFWRNEFDKYPPAFRAESISPILNKMGVFITSQVLRNTIRQENTINLRHIMDSRKILIMNLAKGKIGEDVSAFLGSLLLSGLYLATLSRSGTKRRVKFYTYVDEMHCFVSPSISNILSEARKFGLSLMLAHQYIGQLPDQIRLAVFGNVGTMISFRIGAEDAAALEIEMGPVIRKDDLINLPKYAVYIKLMIDGVTSRPFSALTLPISYSKQGWKRHIIQSSRTKYSEKVKNDATSHVEPNALEDPNRLF